MGFTTPDFPDVDPEQFLAKPLMERMRLLALNWAANGFGSPRTIHTVYITKLVFFYALGAILVARLTSGLPAFWHVSAWWNQPIVYELDRDRITDRKLGRSAIDSNELFIEDLDVGDDEVVDQVGQGFRYSSTG